MDAFDKAYAALVKEQDKGLRRLHYLMLSIVLNVCLTVLLVGALLTP